MTKLKQKTILIFILVMCVTTLLPSISAMDSLAKESQDSSHTNTVTIRGIVWYAFVISGVVIVILLLNNRNRLNYPTDFVKYAQLQFFGLSCLAVCLIFSIALFPSTLFDQQIPISTVLNSTSNTWFFNIGGPGKPSLQIPIYVIVTGILGAYIRYLYVDIGGFRKHFAISLQDFKLNIDNHRRFVSDMCRSIGTSYDIIPKDPKQKYVLSRDLIKYIGENSAVVYDLPPKALKPFETFISASFTTLVNLEIQFNKMKLNSRVDLNYHILETLGAFLLAPLLAIVAWLTLEISGTVRWEAIAIVSFGAGLSIDTIIKRMIGFASERIGSNDDNTTEKPSEEKITPNPKP